MQSKPLFFGASGPSKHHPWNAFFTPDNKHLGQLHEHLGNKWRRSQIILHLPPFAAHSCPAPPLIHVDGGSAWYRFLCEEIISAAWHLLWVAWLISLIPRISFDISHHYTTATVWLSWEWATCDHEVQHLNAMMHIIACCSTGIPKHFMQDLCANHEYINWSSITKSRQALAWMASNLKHAGRLQHFLHLFLPSIVNNWANDQARMKRVQYFARVQWDITTITVGSADRWFCTWDTYCHGRSWLCTCCTSIHRTASHLFTCRESLSFKKGFAPYEKALFSTMLALKKAFKRKQMINNHVCVYIYIYPICSVYKGLNNKTGIP